MACQKVCKQGRDACAWKQRSTYWQCYANTKLLRLAVFHVTFGHLYESCWSRRHSKRKPGRLNKPLACLWWSYMALLKYCIYCVSAPSLHRESTNSLIYDHHMPATQQSKLRVTEVWAQAVTDKKSLGSSPQVRHHSYYWKWRFCLVSAAVH